MTTKEFDIKLAGTIVAEITKRPKMQPRFPELFRTTRDLEFANRKAALAEEAVHKSRVALAQVMNIAQDAQGELDSAILNQANAFVKEVVRR